MSHWTLTLIAAAANVALNLQPRQRGKSLDTSSLRDLVVSLPPSPWMRLAGLSAIVPPTPAPVARASC